VAADDPLPMFPLGSVLLPGGLLPLHLFEPRYRALAHHVTVEPGLGRFGVTLIERGSEVGGGDVRTDVGVVAQVVQAQELDDGRWQMLAAGTERIRVTGWLDDAPFPRALVEPWPDRDAGDQPPDIVELLSVFHDLIAVAERSGQTVPDELRTVDADPVRATWQIIDRSPLGPSDRLTLLRVGSAAERADAARDLLAEQVELMAVLNDLDHDPDDGPDDDRE